MKDVQKKLLDISTSLTSLVKKVDKLATAIEKKSAKATPRKKVKAKVRRAKTPAKKTRPQKASTSTAPTMLDTIFGMISRSRNGIMVERIKKRTGLEARQVSNALYKLTKKGKIKTISRGLYVKNKK